MSALEREFDKETVRELLDDDISDPIDWTGMFNRVKRMVFGGK